MLEQIHFKTKKDFRDWLEKNHDKSEGIWMLYFKKHTQKENIEYSDALDEALCLGWIDSIVKRLDDDRYLRKFTPRKDIKNWSEVNKVRVLKLIREERMTVAGLQKIESYIKSGVVEWPEEKERTDFGIPQNIPDDICKALKDNPPAWKNFQAMTRRNQNNYIGWVMSAKRAETRETRLIKVIDRLKENLKPGLV